MLNVHKGNVMSPIQSSGKRIAKDTLIWRGEAVTHLVAPIATPVQTWDMEHTASTKGT